MTASSTSSLMVYAPVSNLARRIVDAIAVELSRAILFLETDKERLVEIVERILEEDRASRTATHNARRNSH